MERATAQVEDTSESDKTKNKGKTTRFVLVWQTFLRPPALVGVGNGMVRYSEGNLGPRATLVWIDGAKHFQRKEGPFG